MINNQHVIKLTASFGVAYDSVDVDIDSLLRRPDEALYQAKADGRNCVRSA